jgi:hypothetical protein
MILFDGNFIEKNHRKNQYATTIKNDLTITTKIKCIFAKFLICLILGQIGSVIFEMFTKFEHN